MKFGFFTDVHYATVEKKGSRRPSLSYMKVKEAMDSFKNKGVEAVVCLGDLVDDSGSIEKNKSELERISGLIHSYGLPFYFLMGNHDYLNFDREEYSAISGFKCGPFAEKIGDVTLIALDANCAENGVIYSQGKVDWADSFVTEEQLDWFEKSLAEADTEKVYVLIHQNLVDISDKRYIVRNADKINKIIKDSNKVTAVFEGHYHPGKEDVINGIPYHTLAGMCEGEENKYFIYEL